MFEEIEDDLGIALATAEQLAIQADGLIAIMQQDVTAMHAAETARADYNSVKDETNLEGRK